MRTRLPLELLIQLLFSHGNWIQFEAKGIKHHAEGEKQLSWSNDERASNNAFLFGNTIVMCRVNYDRRVVKL